MSSPEIQAGAPARSRDDRGQTAIEFVGTVPMMLAVLVILWQCALTGYTFSLAGNAADKAVRAGTVTNWIWLPGGRELACEKAGQEDLPTPWREGADIDCQVDPDNVEMVEATVDLKVPLLFPGGPMMDINIPGEASAMREN